MTILIVVNDPKDWPLELDIDDVELVAARTYLTDSSFAERRNVKVFNLCRYYRYQSTGYYVSLLAAARGHKPLPDITTIQDLLQTQTVIRTVSDELDTTIQQSLAHIKSKDFVLSIYFGHNLAKQHEKLSQSLFRQFQAPFLRANFALHEKSGKWLLQNINPIPASEIPAEHRPFVVEAAKEYFARRHVSRRRTQHRYDLAILTNPDDTEAPSNQRALKNFVKAAETVGMSAEMIEKDDYGRLAEFDALFIRETTNVNHHTYRFARRAAVKNLVVIDDPESILKCSNKVFLAELLSRNKILTPKTVIVHKDNWKDVVGELGLPCILKKPDSSFSQGVVKVETEADLRATVARMLEKSDLVIAQEFLPTEFDWRVGIMDRQPLYVCKYFMAAKHWQIIKRDTQGVKMDDGYTSTIPVEHAQDRLIKTAMKAANLIGDGFYGVDIKQIQNNFYLIEINDNPSIDAGIEDAVLKEELYLRIMRVFLRRIEQRKGRLPIW